MPIDAALFTGVKRLAEAKVGLAAFENLSIGMLVRAFRETAAIPGKTEEDIRNALEEVQRTPEYDQKYRAEAHAGNTAGKMADLSP